MSSRRWILCALALVLASSAPLSAWGFDVHRVIADRAIDRGVDAGGGAR